MENASKALMFAGTILITLMVISAVVFMYRDLTSVKRQESENQKVEEIAEFNKSFESYEKDLKGAQIFSLANKITDYNNKYAGNDGYEAITLTVNVGSKENNDKYYKNLQSEIDGMIKDKYMSSNYLEALHEAKENENNVDKKTREKAKETIDDLKKKLGNKYNNAYGNVNKDWEKYNNEYKAIKNKTFKSEGVKYYSNGRIESMTYTQIN